MSFCSLITKHSCVAACITIIAAATACAEETCSYSTWDWNAEKQRAENFQDVVKSKRELTPEEWHSTLPCSICREDQQIIELADLKPFFVCRHVADEIETALGVARSAGFPLHDVIGYRVGRTKGLLNIDGRRSQYSLHAYGLALDINPALNGLYDQCEILSPSCRLRRGGAWRPGTPGTVTPGTPIYEEIAAMGWRWGGELAGRQKDTMHFSPSGE